MKHRLAIFAGFHQGMIDNVEGDFQFEDNKPMNSCLWLENFTPNRIIQSAILRNGIDYNRNEARILDRVWGSPVFFLNAIDGAVQPKFLGATSFSTTRPFDHDIVCIFVNKLLNDGVEVSVVSRTLDSNENLIWHEPYTFEQIPKDVKALGVLKDFYNYANNLLFVTWKQDSQITHTEAHPVYIYSYDDLDRELKKVLMPIDYVRNTVGMWKLRKPLKYLLENNKIRVTSFDFGNTMAFNPFEYYENIVHGRGWIEVFGVNSNFDYTIPRKWHHKPNWTGNDDSTNIEIPFSYLSTLDSRLAGHSKYQLVNELTNDKTMDKVDVLFWQTDELPYKHKNRTKAWTELPYRKSISLDGSPKNVGETAFPVTDLGEVVNNFYMTIEKLNSLNDKWIPYCKVAPIKGNDYYYQAHTHYNVVTDYSLEGWLNAYRQMKVKKYKIRYTATDEIMDIEALPVQGATGRYDTIMDNIPVDGNVYSWENMDSRVLVQMNNLANDGSVLHNKVPHTTFTAMLLPNYIKTKTPRPWMTGEVIPYVLTAVINGVEVEVKRGKYEIPPSWDFPTLEHQTKYMVNRYKPLPSSPNSISTHIYTRIDANTLKGGNPNSIHSCFNPYTYSNIFYGQDPALRVNHLASDELKKEGLRKLFTPFRVKESDPFTEDPTYEEMAYGYFSLYPVWHRFPYVMFTIRLNYASIEEALNDLPSGLTEFKLYVSGANEAVGLINRDIRGITHNVSSGGYSLPYVTDEESNAYRYVKSFVVKGDEGDKNIENVWEQYDRSSQGTMGKDRTNYWRMMETSQVVDPKAPKHLYEPASNGLIALPYNATGTNLNLRNVETVGVNWTPDFYLWDYPAVTPMLIDNVSATGEIQLWQGIGAKLITATRGATVIGGCQDEDGIEEVGRIRVSLNQNGKQTSDVFTEWDYLQVSRDSLTALCNFNETIIAFSREGYTKSILNDLTNAATWVVSAEVRGQGVIQAKQTAETPYGVVFCNYNGIYITDGNKHDEIGMAIKNTYLRAISKPSLHSNSFGNINEPSATLKDVEVIYVAKNNEVHIHVFTTNNIEVAFIYDFQFQNWRVYSYPTRHFPWSGLRQLWDNAINGKSGAYLEWRSDLEVSEHSLWYEYLKPFQDNYLFMERYYDVQNRTNDCIPNIPSLFLDYVYDTNIPITGKIVSHDIGNGQDDYLLDDIMIEAYPIDNEIGQDVNALYDALDPDPILSIATRHQSNSSGITPQIEHLYELIGRSIKNGWRKWLIRNSPTNFAPGRNSSKIIRTRESFYFRVPFGIKFRKGVIYFQTRGLSMIREIKLKMREYTRRHFS